MGRNVELGNYENENPITKLTIYSKGDETWWVIHLKKTIQDKL